MIKFRYIFFAGMLTTLPGTVFSQADSSRYVLLDSLRAYINRTVELETGDAFYTSWSSNPVKVSYIYVCRNDTLAPPEGTGNFIYVGEDSLKADSLCIIHEQNGYSVMHYRTAGTSAAKLNGTLWNYPVEAFVFIVLHEAVHVHLKNTDIRMLYVFEEALGDAIAAWYTPLFLSGDKDAKRMALQQNQINAKLYRFLNNLETDFYKKQRDKNEWYHQASLKVETLLKKGNRFQYDRFQYPLNGAYLMRYRSYVKYYAVIMSYLEAGIAPQEVITLLSGIEKEEKLPSYTRAYWLNR